VRHCHPYCVRQITGANLAVPTIDAGDPVVIVDLRHPLEQVGAPQGLPGAIHMQPKELDERYQEIPRDRDVVRYCA